VATEELRPSPEHFLTLIRQQKRGLLKVYLGYAAGVGKTYDMLQDGHRFKRKGVDVVIGFVETHGRVETEAQIGDLEQVPRKRIEYRGVTLEEMDLDALLKRRPTIALVDELAHTNAPGSTFAKRYQDVEELLRAGINVISTLNIQHLESLYNLVEQVTGVKVKERVPDYVLGMANELVTVDLSAEDLRERLSGGKIYPAERIERALTNFFTPENLTRLREIASREIAHLLERHRRETDRSDGRQVTDRIMVCLSSRSPHPDILLRKGARLADRLGAPWYAVYVQTPQESLERIDAATQRLIANTQQLASQLGATMAVTWKGEDVVETIATFVKEYNITQVVLGRSRQPWYRRILGPSLLERLLRTVPHVDMLVVDTE
jgi:two-component system sensor histidine kinase KdpD